VSSTHGDAVRRIAAVSRDGRTALRFSFSELRQVRERIGTGGVVTSVVLQPVVIRVERTDIQTMAEVVDGSYFHVTGTAVLKGRGLVSTDDAAAAPPVIVISEPFWRRRFGASASALGAVVLLNGSPYTIVGVSNTLGSSTVLGASVDAWVPAWHADPLLDRDWRTDPARRLFTAFVLPRAAAVEIDARLEGAASDLAGLYPETWRERRLTTAPGSVLAGSLRSSVVVLTAVLGGLALLILATSAANLGGLLLARAAGSRRQAAIHLSMGSGRAALVRRQLIEGAVLGIVAGGIALAVYAWARTTLAEIAVLPTLALRLDLPFDAALVSLVIIAGALTGALLATGPALWAARVDLAGALRDSESRAGDGRGLTGVRRVLVSAQVALTLVLIVGAALFSRSLQAMADADLGFPSEGLVAVDFDLEPSSARRDDLPRFAQEALRRVGSLPGVTAAAMSNRAPVDQSTPTLEVRGGGAGGPAVGDVTFATVTSAYFETAGIPLVAGRSFTAYEVDAAADVVIVNQSLAQRLWPGESAVDRALYVPAENRPLRIVGVARNSKYRTITESGHPHVYRPTPPRLGLALLVRTTTDPRETLRAVQQSLDAVGPGLVGFFPRTLDDHLVVQLLPMRAAAGAATLLGTLALALSGVGLYSLVSWFVALRVREIGVRVALGATRGDIQSMIVRQALRTALPGMLAGIAGAAGLGLITQSVLFGVGPLDPVALATGIGALTMVIILAGYSPSRRVTALDPAGILRQ
jgi:predicted permease